MRVRDFGKETNIFLLDTSELDLSLTDGRRRGLKGVEYGSLPSIGELEAWFIFECPVAIEQSGIDEVMNSASEEFGVGRDIIEPLMMLIISGLKNDSEKRKVLFKSIR